jgi:hypothetical protein
MTGASKSDDAKRRKGAAESLRRQIDDIVSGHARPAGPGSFRDFVKHKMAEERSKKSTSGTPTWPTEPQSAKDDPSSKSAPGRERE